MIDNRTAPYAVLVLRLALSFFFFAHLIRKFAVIGFDPWWTGLVKQGYPGVVLGYTVAIEFAGALLLLLGVYTRYVSLFSLPVLIAVANHWMVRKGFWFADGGMEFPLAWVFMLIAQVLLGDGAYALRVPALPWERRQPATARSPALYRQRRLSGRQLRLTKGWSALGSVAHDLAPVPQGPGVSRSWTCRTAAG